METRNKCVPVVYALIEKEGKILMTRRCNTGYADGMYQVPAGHIEEGELPSEALIREAKEEIDVELTKDDIELVHISYRPKHDETGDRVDFFFNVKKWTGEIRNAEPDKCDDLRWFSSAELPENIPFHVKMGIKNINKGIFFTEISLEAMKKSELYKL